MSENIGFIHSTTFNEKKGNRLPFRGRTGKPPHSFLAPGSGQPVFPQERLGQICNLP